MDSADKILEALEHSDLEVCLKPPASSADRMRLEKNMKNIPADYAEFLNKCNGLTLYGSGDYCLFSVQQILSAHFSENNTLCEAAWKIGYWMGYDILIKTGKEKEYLYAGDCCSTDEFICVGAIWDFLEGVIKSKGDPYWDIDPQQYVDFSK